MSARRRIESRQAWTIGAWLVIAALAAAAIASSDVSMAIGAGVAAVWALCFGFFPARVANRP